MPPEAGDPGVTGIPPPATAVVAAKTPLSVSIQ